MTARQAYHPAQIWLHWIVVLGVILQIAIHEPIVAVVAAREGGPAAAASDVSLAWVHVGVGSVIMFAVIARLILRWRHGAPDHAPGMSELQARLASAMHSALYGLLIGMVITGMLTWNEIAPLGSIHFALNVALFFAALAHAAAAIYNQIVRKDGTLARMKPRF
jgi:cytochrome b561